MQCDATAVRLPCLLCFRRATDHLNCYIKFNYSVSRTRLRGDGVWSAWGEWRDQQPPEIVAKLWKNNGQWFASDMRNTGQTMSNLTAPTLGNLGDLLTSQMPGTGELIKSQLGSLTFDQLLATMKQPSCADISNPAARASPVLPTTVAPVAKITPFSGTADEFAAAFPGFLRTAAVARGLDPHTLKRRPVISRALSKHVRRSLRKCGAARLINMGVYRWKNSVISTKPVGVPNGMSQVR